LQQCGGDWWPLSSRRSRVAHAALLATDTEICDTVRLAGCKSNQVPDMIRHTLVHLSLPILFLKTARIFWACFLCSDRLVHHNLSCHNHRVRRPTDLGGSFDGILQPSLESYARAVRARGPLCRA
jgi:hypothetical protein